MKFSALTLILLVSSGCSSGIFDAKESTMRKIAGTEAAGSVDTNSSGSAVDQAATGTKSDAADSGANKDAADAKASSTPKASADGAASGAEGTAAERAAAERAAAIARACPQIDPKVIEQLIASGQPFEVECEVEIEVGPDND
jgi:hypothetical protein